MVKSKESVERQLVENKKNPLEIADHHENKYKKSTINRSSAKFSGTANKEE